MDLFSKEHTLKILDLLYYACIAEGGDGDCLWYSKYRSIEAIMPVLEEYNSSLKFPFQIHKFDDKSVHWGDNQEWIFITTDSVFYEENRDRYITVHKG